MRKYLLLAAMLAVGAITPVLAAVGVGYSLFGSATYVSPGENSNRAVQLISNADQPYGGIDYTVSTGLTFADLSSLGTDYKFEQGSCGGGSPRFINVQTPSNDVLNMQVYIGPPPNYTGCAAGTWTPSGDVLHGTIDTSQLPGGTFYDPYASALAKYGSYPVVGIQLVADAGWMFPTTGQVVDIDNTDISGTTYDYEFTNKDDCKKNGWATNFPYSPGPFKNQGQCVSYFAKQQH